MNADNPTILKIDPWEELRLDPAAARLAGGAYRDLYAAARPFPHAVLDNFLPETILDRVLEGFPAADHAGTVVYGHQRKRQINPTHLSSMFARNLFFFFNSEAFIEFLEVLTGLTGLIPDPFFVGAGLHEIAPGGKLPIHADFRIHRRLSLLRRVNLLIYLNRNWESDWGGDLELWDHRMETCVRAIRPVFNRCVIFNTDAFSFHGHPNPLKAPEGVTRKSIALYYYSASTAIYNEVPDNTTDYRARPGEGWRFRAENFVQRIRNGIHEVTPPIVRRVVRLAKAGGSHLIGDR